MGAALITGHTIVPGAPGAAISHEPTKPLAIPPPGSPRTDQASMMQQQSDDHMATIATVVAVAKALGGTATSPTAPAGNGRRPGTLAGIVAGVLSSVATSLGIWGAHEQYGSAEAVARMDAQDQETKALREDVKAIKARVDTQDQETKALREDVKALRDDVKGTRAAMDDMLDVLERIADGGKDTDPLGIKQIRRRMPE